MVKCAAKWSVEAVGATLFFAGIAILFGAFGLFVFAVWTSFWMSWPLWAHLIYPAIFVGLYAVALVWRSGEIVAETIARHRR